MKFRKGEDDSIVAVKVVPPDQEIEEPKNMVGVATEPIAPTSADVPVDEETDEVNFNDNDDADANDQE